MSNFFDYFTIVSNLVRYISWSDIKNFKKISSLCLEVCEREEIRRCFGILFGNIKLEKSNSRVAKRRKIDMNYCISQLKENFRCKTPKLVLIVKNSNENIQIQDLLINQCSPDTIVCLAFSKHGVIGSSYEEQNKISCKYFSSNKPVISWICLPNEVEVEILTSNSEIKSNTKLVIVLNDSRSQEMYSTKIFSDNIQSQEPVYYCGGLVNSIEIFNYSAKCFERKDYISISIGGENFSLDTCILKEQEQEPDVVEQKFSAIKARNDRLLETHKMKYQCILIFSCFFRRRVKLNYELKPLTEYEYFSKFFPNIPIVGMLCEGEVFHVNDGVVKLVRSLHDDDIDGNSSIFSILSWTKVGFD